MESLERSAGVGQGSVLIVDDSPLIRAMVGRMLKKAGYVIEEASNGSQALEALARNHHDVVITDLRMPEMDGFGVLSGVKRVAPDVEVIILTGTHGQDLTSAVRALRLGAHDYLTKPPTSADQVVLTVQRAIDKKRLKEANQRLLRELETLSRTDALTGVNNRRVFDEVLGQEMTRSRRYGHPLSLVLLDIDHFKRHNDTHGHAAGDEVLRRLPAMMTPALREGDTLYRYGGEEFAILLPHAGLQDALAVAERVLRCIASSPVSLGPVSVPVTASAGVATLQGADRFAGHLVSRADAGLYEAKEAGRNCARANGERRLALVASR